MNLQVICILLTGFCSFLLCGPATNYLSLRKKTPTSLDSICYHSYAYLFIPKLQKQKLEDGNNSRSVYSKKYAPV